MRAERSGVRLHIRTPFGVANPKAKMCSGRSYLGDSKKWERRASVAGGRGPGANVSETEFIRHDVNRTYDQNLYRHRRWRTDCLGPG